jgi:hypothetical protein
VLGVYNVCISEKTQKTFAAEKVIIHEKYTNGSAYHDIALIILNGTARDYTPICLPKPGNCLMLGKWFTNTKIYSSPNPTK